MFYCIKNTDIRSECIEDVVEKLDANFDDLMLEICAEDHSMRALLEIIAFAAINETEDAKEFMEALYEDTIEYAKEVYGIAWVDDESELDANGNEEEEENE